MSGQIRMSPEELDSRANGYGQGAEQIRVTLQQLQQLQEVLRGEWEGAAFREFDAQFIQLKGKTEEFAELLMQIQRQLKETARAMHEQDQALSKNFGLD